MSEFSIIEHYFKTITSSHLSTVYGIGDDCAISDIPAQQQLVSCVDTLVAGRHFPMDTSAHAIAWRSVAVNLSDLAAMGAKPYAILLALSLPHVDESWLAEFSRGLSDICQQYHLDLIGGDTTQSPTLTISVTALGFVPRGNFITRRGAMVDDLICVSGHIGDASLALADVLQNKSSPLQMALDYPQPQTGLGQNLIHFASSMIDISDGLAQDLGHILAQSHVGARIDIENIPCSSYLQQLPLTQRIKHQLTGGDDYQLCFTIRPDLYQQFCQQYHLTPAIIGKITAEPNLQIYYQDQLQQINTKGYQHFAT